MTHLRWVGFPRLRFDRPRVSTAPATDTEGLALTSGANLHSAATDPAGRSDPSVELATLLAHEVRALANSTLGTLQLVVQGRAEESMRATLFSMLEQQARSLLAVVDSLLRHQAHRRSARRKGEELLVDLVEATVLELATLASAKGLALLVEAPEELRALQAPADAVALAQILRNLLSNAIKFSSRGTVRVSVQRGEDVLTISVSDSGAGIAADQRKKLFQPFEPGCQQESGAGLGLWISSTLAQTLGAGLEVTSEVGMGSTFSLRLPWPAAATPALPPGPV